MLLQWHLHSNKWNQILCNVTWSNFSSFIKPLPVCPCCTTGGRDICSTSVFLCLSCSFSILMSSLFMRQKLCVAFLSVKLICHNKRSVSLSVYPTEGSGKTCTKIKKQLTLLMDIWSASRKRPSTGYNPTKKGTCLLSSVVLRKVYQTFRFRWKLYASYVLVIMWNYGLKIPFSLTTGQI